MIRNFPAKAFEWSDVYVPKRKDPKFCGFNATRNAIEWFEMDEETEKASLENISSNLVKTVKIRTYLSILRAFLEKEVPFSLIGPSGSGTR